MLIASLLLFPPAAGVLLLALKSKRANVAVIYAYAVLQLGAALALWVRPERLAPFFAVDDLNILFLLVLSVLYFGVAFYQGDFLKHSGLSPRWHTWYAVCLLLFGGSMTGVILSTHLGLLWVFVEATTLASAPFIYYEGDKAALEATWKYVFICSVGIALAFVGVILLSMSAGRHASLFFDDLAARAGSLSPFWLKLAFPFILVGFGTKAGLAPVHAWLPDAHAESPAPISAILSGTLLNTALLGILRVYRIMDLAGQGAPARTLLLVMGFLSLFVCAVFIIRNRNYKRMLAYSSIEHIGLVAIGTGLGGAGVFAAMLHLVAHSLGKASLFLTSGNILADFRTKEVGGVRGLIRLDPLTGGLWIAGFLAVSAFPPFPAFLSELRMAGALLAGGRVWLLVAFLLLLTIILGGMGHTVLQMTFGRPDPALAPPPRIPASNYVPQLLFLVVLAVLGLAMPDEVLDLIQRAAAALGAGRGA
jgi:hydrogenase-4 component F